MDLRKELMEFVEANNWFSLEDSKNAENVIDVYLKTYKKQCAINGVGNSKRLNNKQIIEQAEKSLKGKLFYKPADEYKRGFTNGLRWMQKHLLD